MQPVASFSIKFSEKFFRKTAKTSSAGFPKQSSRKRNKVRPKDGGSSAPVYAGLQLDCAGVPAMQRLFFHKVQKNQMMVLDATYISAKKTRSIHETIKA